MRAIHLAFMKDINYKELKNLILFSAGKIFSVFGTSIYTFALGLYVLQITGSALSFAVTLVLGTIPMIIINPFAGVIADKFNKKKLVVSMDLLNGIVLIIVYLLSSLYGLNLIMIYSTAFLLTIFTTVFGMAMETAKPNIVSEKMLLNINSISKIIDSVSSILGPMLGGLVFAVIDIKIFILINGISFIISAASECFIDFNFNGEAISEIKPKINFIKDIKEGVKYLYERKNIKSLFVIMISLNFFLGFSVTVPLPYIINTVFKLGSISFGIIEGSFPIGMIIGALLVKRISEKISYSRLLKYTNAILAICMILMGIPIFFVDANINQNFYQYYYCILMTIFGVAIALIDIPIIYLIQKIIPEEFRGRVLSIGISIGKTMLPIALLISGMLLAVLPAYSMPITGGIMLLTINVLTIRNQSF